jgi:hypothetical protein
MSRREYNRIPLLPAISGAGQTLLLSLLRLLPSGR